MKAEITIYTAGLTDDSLDPHATLKPEAWATERQRYIDLAVAAVQAAFPDAEVDTEPGNGLDNYSVWTEDDEPGDADAIEDGLDYILEKAYETWTETVPDCSYR